MKGKQNQLRAKINQLLGQILKKNCGVFFEWMSFSMVIMTVTDTTSVSGFVKYAAKHHDFVKSNILQEM